MTRDEFLKAHNAQRHPSMPIHLIEYNGTKCATTEQTLWFENKRYIQMCIRPLTVDENTPKFKNGSYVEFMDFTEYEDNIEYHI